MRSGGRGPPAIDEWNITPRKVFLGEPIKLYRLRYENRADKQFALLKSNPRYPSLQFKKMGESRGHEVWSGARHSEPISRLLALKRADGFFVFSGSAITRVTKS